MSYIQLVAWMLFYIAFGYFCGWSMGYRRGHKDGYQRGKAITRHVSQLVK
jgi:predicted permease